MVQKQDRYSLSDIGLSLPVYNALLREGFGSTEDLALCSRLHLTALLGKEAVDEIELCLMRLGLRLSLSRSEKLAAIKQMAIASFDEDGPQAARLYFIEAVIALLNETGETRLMRNPQTSRLLSGNCRTSSSFADVIDTVYSQVFSPVSTG